MTQLQHLDDYARQAVSKKDIKVKACSDAETLLESGKDVTPYYVQAMRIAEYATNYLTPLKERVIEERERYAPTEKVRVLGAEVQVVEAGTRYDFSHCGDREWAMLKEAAETAAAALKECEDRLKALKKPMENQLDPESGEVYTIYPPIKRSTTAPRISY
jgi:hypothetical protein